MTIQTDDFSLPPGAAEGRWSLLRGLPPVDALSMGLSLTHCARVGTRAWCWGGARGAGAGACR